MTDAPNCAKPALGTITAFPKPGKLEVRSDKTGWANGRDLARGLFPASPKGLPLKSRADPRRLPY